MNMKLLRTVVAGVASLAAATVIGSGGSPGVAAAAITCQRSVAIDPQVTVSEGGRSLTFVVHTGGCAAAGEVSYTVLDGTAQRQVDFALANGILQWPAGDMSSREITATVIGDTITEAALETFTVMLVNPSQSVRVAGRYGLGRVFDDDIPGSLATVDSRVCLVYKEACADGLQGLSSSPKNGVRTLEPGLIIIAPIQLDEPSSVNQTVNFDTSDGTLLANVHYQPVHRAVTIPAGALIAYVPVRLTPHAITLGGYLNVHLSNYTGGGVISGTGQITVLN